MSLRLRSALAAAAVAVAGFVTPATAATAPSGATLTATVTSDGTGHGTSEACFVTSANGFSGPVDNSATDGVVCSNDLVLYSMAFAAPATSTPTTYRLKFESPDTATAVMTQDSYTWCASDPSGRWTAVSVEKSAARSVCDITVPANVSVSSSFATRVSVVPQPAAATLAPTVSVTQASVTSTTAAPATTIASALAWDALTGLSSVTPATVRQNGSTYLRWTLNVGVSSGYRWAASATNFKGMSHTGIADAVTVDVSSLPAGALVQNLGAGMGLNGTSLTWSRTVPFSTTSTNPATKQPSTFGTADILIPLPAAGTTGEWTVPISATSLRPATVLGYPTNWGRPGMEPGEGKARSASTAGATQLVYDGQTNPNNNYTTMSVSATPPSTLLSKTLLNPDGSSALYSLKRPGAPLVAVMTVAPYPVVVDRFAVCDMFAPSEQSVDTSKPIVVTGTGMDGAATVLPASAYDVWYSTTTNACGPSTSASSDAGWTTNPAGAAAVKVVVKGPGIDLSSPSSVRFEVRVPMTLGSQSAFPNYPGNTVVNDRGVLATGSGSSAAWGTEARAYVQVNGPTPTVQTFTQVSTVNSSGSAGPDPVAAGNSYWAANSIRTGLSSSVASDSGGHRVTFTGTISSCAVGVRDSSPAPATGTASMKNFTVSLTPPNLGPDGVACTSDDVSGWTYAGSYDVVTPAGNVGMVTSGPSFEFTVAPWARDTDKVTTSIVATVSFPGAKSVTATSADTPSVQMTRTTGQFKAAVAPRVESGLDAAWELDFFNSRAAAVSGAEFIDVLPYVGDGRGTTLSAPLSNVRLDVAGLPAGAGVYVTTAPGSSVPRDVSDQSVDPSNPMWCLYGSACAPAGQPGPFTAVYVNVPTFAAGAVARVTVTAATTGTVNGDRAVNSLGVGRVASLGTAVLAGTNQQVALYRSSVSGVVYADSNVNHMRDAGEPGVAGHRVMLLDGSGRQVASTVTDASGAYAFAALPSGTYSVRVAALDSAVFASVTQAGPEVASPTTTSPPVTLSDGSSPTVNFGFAGTPKVTFTTTVDKAVASPGATLTYTMSARNTGQVDVTATLAPADCTGLTDLRATLSPGAERTWTCTATATPADLTAGARSITARLTVTDANPATADQTLTADASTRIVAPASVSIDKTADIDEGSVGHVGQKVTWRYRVTNTGGYTITRYTVTDDKLGDVCTAVNLAPTDSFTCTATGTLS